MHGVTFPPLIAVPLVALVMTGCTSAPPVPKPAPTVAAANPSPASSSAPGVDYSIWSAGRSTPVADPIYPRRGNPAIDVLHYGLDLAWAPKTKTFTGQATVQLRAVADLAEIALDFSAAYRLDAVTLDGADTTGAVANEKLKISKPLAKDAFTTSVAKDGSLWTMQEPYGSFTWYPSNDQPSDKALYDIAITAPQGWAGIASGTPNGQEGNVYRYTSKDPVATYLTTLAVGKYKKETVSGPHGLAITYWYRPGKDDAAMKLVRKSPTYVSWLEKRFGPYPFPSAGIVMVPSASGMETQQMITMGTPKVRESSQFAMAMDGDLLHEYAHQWFGDTLTPTSSKDLWLNEGWAMYAQLLYEVERDHITGKQFDSWFRSADAKVRAKSGPPGNPRADSFAETNVYICPALMLRMIHKQIGDRAFFALARDWAQQNRNSSQDRTAFIAFVNKHTGKDFTRLINTWLDSKTTPR